MNSSRKPVFRPGWVIYLLPAVLSVVAAFVLGSVRVGPLPTPSFEWNDKLGHFIAFGFVAVTHIRALRFIYEPLVDIRQIKGGVLSSTVVGGLLELWQALLPYRSAEWADFLADGLGALLAGAIYAAVERARV